MSNLRLLCLLLCATFCASQLPGFKTIVTQNGLTYLKDVGVKLLEIAVGTLSIPDLSGEADTPVGKVDWDLSNIKLDQFSIAASQVSTVANQGISLGLTDVSAHVGLDWHYKKKHWPHVSDHGSADISVSVSAAVSLQITTVQSRPHLLVVSDDVEVNGLKIKLHGGASWLYDLFINAFSHQIKQAVAKALTDAISSNIDHGVNKALSTLPISEPVGPHQEAEINFELLGNPIFTSSYLSAPELGEFYVTASPQECPDQYCPRATTPDVVTNEMLQMVVTDFVANSAGFTFYKLGKLSVKIDDKDVPSWSPFRLNTTSFKYLLPQLYQAFPNDLMEILLYATQPPQAVFHSNGASVSAVGNLEVSAIVNGTLQPAFTLTGSVQTAGLALLKGMTISGNLTYIKGNFSILKSEIGQFDVSLFDSILNLMFSSGVVPAVNTFLSTGFVLPTVQGLTFINPTLGWGERYLYVSTGINYVPPTTVPAIQKIMIA